MSAMIVGWLLVEGKSLRAGNGGGLGVLFDAQVVKE